MENSNKIKLCYTKKASMIPAIISITISLIFTIGFCLLPFFVFLTMKSTPDKIFYGALSIVVAFLISSFFIRMGIIWCSKIIKQRIKINKIMPEYLCEYDNKTKTFTIDILGEKTIIKSSEIKDIVKSTNNNANYVFCKIKVEHDCLTTLCFVLQDEFVELPFIKNINKEIETIKELIK